MAHPTLNVGLRRDFTWRFLVTDVQLPIFGVDLLANFNLLVDCPNNRILNGVTSPSTPALTASTRFPSVETIGSSTPADDLFAEFQGLTRPSGDIPEVRHNTVHYIKTTPGPLVSCQPRRLAPERIAIAKAEFGAMLKDGTTRRSAGSWSSALNLFPKKDNGRRPCGEYRALNALTIPDRYPAQHIHDYDNQLAGCKIFSNIDLVRAYHQIPVNPDTVQKTDITKPFGFFEFQLLSFGLRNAAKTFRRFMDEIQSGFDFFFAYIDDILVYSR
jgi:hypothetical protein